MPYQNIKPGTPEWEARKRELKDHLLEYGRVKFHKRPKLLANDELLSRATRNALYAVKHGAHPKQFSDEQLLLGREAFRNLFKKHDKKEEQKPQTMQEERITPPFKYRAHVAKGRSVVRRKF